MQQLFALAFLFLCLACSNLKKESIFIALDPTFFSMPLSGKEPQVIAFCNELLTELSHQSKYHFFRLDVPGGDLLDGLRQEQYPVIISSTYPYLFNTTVYAFSPPILYSGPVLIAKRGTGILSFNTLRNQTVAILDDTAELFLMQAAPEVLPRREETCVDALMKVASGQLDAAFLPVVPSISYVQDRYGEDLIILTTPAGDAGLRCVTLRSEEELMHTIDKGIRRLEASGTLKELQVKWGLALTR